MYVPSSPCPLENKDILKEQIPTLDVENALLAHPAVAEAVAVGVEDPRLGEVVGAIVSLHTGKEASPEDVLESVKSMYALPFRGPWETSADGKDWAEELGLL